MSEQGSPATERSAFLLVVAAPGDEKALELIQELRQAGLFIMVGHTTALVAHLLEGAAACVAVLRPDTWKSPIIATAMRARPACLIPVLAETMQLPPGPWTWPAIDLSANAEQGKQELIQTLNEYLARYTPTQAQQAHNALVSMNNVKIKPLPIRRTHRRKRGRTVITTVILLLVILSLGGLIAYRYYSPHPTTGISSLPGNSTPLFSQYSTNTPGSCDLSGGRWNTGGHYIKTVNKQKVEVVDKYTTLSCQSDGTLVTRTGDEDIYSELFFEGPAGLAGLTTHYQAQIKATIVTGDTNAGLTLNAHIQDYAGYSFSVDQTGYWEATINNQTDGSPLKTLASGYLTTISKTYILGLEVYGPTMTFAVNGTRLTSVTDTTYSVIGDLAFGVDDYHATKPVSALFSQFQYKSLQDTLTSAQLVATATAQAQKDAQTPYSAAVPGYGCDKGAGQWKPVDVDTGKLHCLTHGMSLSTSAHTTLITEEHFHWLGEAFPQNYKVSAKIDVSGAPEGCAGLGTRQQRPSNNTGGGYYFMICPDGSWAIILITSKFHILSQGQTTASSTYTMTASAQGDKQSLYLNGKLISTVKDKSLTSTSYLCLEVGLYNSNQTQSATFSNFIFTPLP